MGRRTSPELQELRERWAWAVLVLASGENSPVGFCWFGENVPGIDSCEGRIEGAHWIKRQRVEAMVSFATQSNRDVQLDENRDWVELAAWDPRNGVPACNKHHTRFDSQRMPTLVVWRHEVPAHVEAFARDWGLEPELERRNPALGGGI